MFWRKEEKVKKKVVYRLTSTIEYKTLEAYLKEMAAKGYMVVKITNAFITFEICEPRALDFNVGLFYKSTFSDERSPEEIDYRKMCTDSGWKFVYSNERFQVFYKEEKEELTPIYTDDEDEYKVMRRIIFKTDFPFIFFMVLYLTMSIVNIVNIGHRDLYTNFDLYLTLWPLILVIPFSIRFFNPVIWLIVNNKRLKNGLELQYPSEKERTRKEVTIAVIMIIYILLFIISMVGWRSNYTSANGLLIVFFVCTVVITVGSMMFIKYLKRIDTKPVLRILMFGGAILLVSYIYLGVIFMLAFTSISEVEEVDEPRAEPSRYAITLEQLGEFNEVSHVSNTEKNSILLDRYYYVEAIFKEGNPDYHNFIHTETIETNAEFIANFVFNDIIEFEKERIEYWENKDPESINVEDYVYKIEIEGLNVESIYVVKNEGADLVIKQGKRVIVIESSHDLLNEESIEMIKETLEL